MAGPWDKYGGRSGEVFALPPSGIEQSRENRENRKDDRDASKDAVTLQLERLRVEAQRLANEKAAREAAESAAEEDKINELRQRDGMLRALAIQIGKAQNAYDQNFRGGFPNWISGNIPRSATQEFDRLANTILDAGQSAFRIPGSGDQGEKELEFKVGAYLPSATAGDDANDANFGYLINRIDQERASLNLPPIDWQALRRDPIAYGEPANDRAPPARGASVWETDTGQPQQQQLAKGEMKRVTDPALAGLNRDVLAALRQGRDAGQIAKMINDRGVDPMPIMGQIQDAVTYYRRNPGYRGGHSIDLETKWDENNPAQRVISSLADTPGGSAFVSFLDAGLPLDEMAGAGKQSDVRGTVDYLRDQYPVGSTIGSLTGMAGMGAMAGGLSSRALGAVAPKLAGKGATIGELLYGGYYGGKEDNENRFAGATIGALSGAGGQLAGQGVMRGLARTVSPSGGDLLPLYNEGVRPTIGQRFANSGLPGRVVNYAEEGLQSVPILGSAIAGARQEARDQFERGAYNTALRELGVELPADKALGRDAYNFTKGAFGDAYETARAGMQFVPDAQYMGEMQAFRDSIVNGGVLDDSARNQLDMIMETTIGSRMRNGAISGDAYKKMISELREKSRMISKPEVREAVNGITSIIDRTARRYSDPDAVKLMDKADKGYGAFATIRDAAKRRGNDEPARFTPKQLDAASAKTAGKSDAYLTGNARMSDYIRAGQSLNDRLPNSGTPERLMLGQGLAGVPTIGGLAALSTKALGVPVAATLPYLPGVRKGMQEVLAPRIGDFFPKVAEEIRRREQIAGILAASGALQLTQN